MRNSLHVALSDHLLPMLSASTLTALVEELAAGGPNLCVGYTTEPKPETEAHRLLKAEKVCLLGRVSQLEYAAETVGEVHAGVLRLCEELQPSVAAVVMNGFDRDPLGTGEAMLDGIGREMERRRAA